MTGNDIEQSRNAEWQDFRTQLSYSAGNGGCKPCCYPYSYSWAEWRFLPKTASWDTSPGFPLLSPICFPLNPQSTVKLKITLNPPFLPASVFPAANCFLTVELGH